MLDSLHIDPRSGVPIYIQIRNQMLHVIGAGMLKPGEQMPTMRQVAVALKVDLNTVRHAYDELEQSGAITIVRARGTFVAKPPSAIKGRELAARLDEHAHRFLAVAKGAGIDPLQLAQRVTQLVKTQGGK